MFQNHELETTIIAVELKIKRVGPWGESELWVEVHDTFLMLENKVFRLKGLRVLRGECPRTDDLFGRTRKYEFERDGLTFAVPFGFLVILEDDF